MAKIYKQDNETRARQSVLDTITESNKKVKKKEIKIHEIKSQKNTNVISKNLKTSSKEWLKRHINDRFVAQAQKDNYVSRAAYKLIEIEEKFQILKNCNKILDLGAAPGSWSQVVHRRYPHTKIVMVDLLDLDPEYVLDKNMHFIKGDFTDNNIQKEILQTLNGKADLILSDISPNLSGIRSHDMIQMSNIIEEIYQFSLNNLSENGKIVMKIFHGSLENELLNKIKQRFGKIQMFKPIASRAKSSEIYMILK